MRATAMAAVFAAVFPLAPQAQEPAAPGERFGRDVVAPLLMDTLSMVESGRLAGDRRPDGPLPRARACHGLAGQADAYRRLGLLPQLQPGFGEAGRGAASAMDRPIRDHMIRAALDRCRREAEEACRRTGDVNAVPDAARAMAVLRTVFAAIDPDRRAGEPALTGAFRRDVGDSDQEWMRRTLDACGRFELVWRSRHAHQCRGLSAPWRQDVEQRFEITARVEDFNPADDGQGGVFGASLAFEARPQPAQVSGSGPGRQAGGLTFAYDRLSVAADGQVTVLRFDIGDEGRLERLVLRFAPPSVVEDAAVTVPRAGRRTFRHEHWREGFLSAHARLRAGGELELGDFAGTGESSRMEIVGQGAVLSETDGCVPSDNSVLRMRHVAR